MASVRTGGRIHDDITGTIGNTPLVRLRRVAARAKPMTNEQLVAEIKTVLSRFLK